MKESILIIEDEEVLLDILTDKLEREGYKVDQARDGEVGMGKLRNKNYDLVLLDIVMPKVDGFEVLEAMNADPELKEVPVIIISNSGQPVEIEKAQKLGIVDYLVKANFSPEEVMDKVRRYLNDS